MTRHRTILITGVVFLAVLTAGCQRTGMDTGTPLGPSSFALTFDLVAQPNVILAAKKRPISIIRATVYQNGKPALNKTVYFTILSGPGEFGDFSHRAVVTTNSDGLASVMFIGPTQFEIDADSDTKIEGRLETTTPEGILKYVDLRILISE